jgi:hypothetical protein
VTTIDPRLTRLCEGYRRAVHEKNVAAFLGLYHPKARVFDTWGPWSYEGEPARRPVITEWFSSLGEERVAVTFDRVQATPTLPGKRTEVSAFHPEKKAELAFLTARVIYTAISASGAELRSMQNRLTWVLKADAGEWKIIHEHTSAPLGPDLKGKLARE